MTGRRRASLMVTCLGDLFFPEVGVSIVRVLQRLGVAVDVPPGQTCCGLPLFNSGYHTEAAAVAGRTVSLFADSDHVVVPSGSCAWMLKHEYPGLLSDAGLGRPAEQVAARVRDVTELLADADLPLGALDLTVTYHDACHLVHGQRVREEPRRLLRRIPGLRLVELRDSDLCCGSAGIYNLLEPGTAGTLRDAKVARIAETGARVVAAANPGCLLQIAWGCRERALDVTLVHPVELLARAADAYQG